MEQWRVIEIVTDLFAKKLSALSSKDDKVEVCIDDFDTKDQKTASIIKLFLFNIEEVGIKNDFEKIQLKGNDKNGDEIDYFVEPPTLLSLKYLVTPYSSKKSNAHKLLGKIIKLIKDDRFIEIDEIDWIKNNKKPVKIESISDMDMNKQLQLFNVLKMDYSPSLFYQMIVGINSENKEIFRRVEKRDIKTFYKK